jgi:hypothetical protein
MAAVALPDMHLWVRRVQRGKNKEFYTEDAEYTEETTIALEIGTSKGKKRKGGGSV